RMSDTLLTSQEADRTQGIPGDTLVDVRQKGFTIYIDEDKKIRRPNTRVLHGNEALTAVGMAVSPPPLQKPEEIRAYADFMAQHYAEEYIERDMTHVADRFCLNTRNSLDIGEDRVFTIVWREGLVFKRVIGGGHVSNAKQERALLVCPGDFLIDTLTVTVNTSTKAVSPIKCTRTVLALTTWPVPGKNSIRPTVTEFGRHGDTRADRVGAQPSSLTTGSRDDPRPRCL